MLLHFNFHDLIDLLVTRVNHRVVLDIRIQASGLWHIPAPLFRDFLSSFLGILIYFIDDFFKVGDFIGVAPFFKIVANRFVFAPGLCRIRPIRHFLSRLFIVPFATFRDGRSKAIQTVRELFSIQIRLQHYTRRKEGRIPVALFINAQAFERLKAIHQT